MKPNLENGGANLSLKQLEIYRTETHWMRPRRLSISGLIGGVYYLHQVSLVFPVFLPPLRPFRPASYLTFLQYIQKVIMAPAST